METITIQSSNNKITLERRVSKGKYEKEYGQVRRYAKILLGNIHHICTNDFSRSDGAIVWTDHGEKHSKRIIENLNALIKLIPSLGQEDEFSLLCAAWLHDVGMFIRHPDFSDLEIQRKYHGRIARSIIRHISDKEEWNIEARKLTNKIAEICELHQSKTSSFNNSGSNNLGNLLLLADGIDVCKDRISGQETEMIRKLIPKFHFASNAEWWINRCIKEKPKLKVNKNILKITYLVDWQILVETAKECDSKTPDAEDRLFEYIKHFFERYIKEEHWKLINKKRDFSFLKDIEIKFDIAGNRNRREKKELTQVESYGNCRELWVEHFMDYDLSNIKSCLENIKSKVFADDIYIFVFDKVRQVIRYLANPIFVDINKSLKDSEEEKEELMKILYNQKIRPKWGIIGHVFFCGLIEKISNLDDDPRRIYSEEDKKLKLHTVIFHPLITKKIERGKDDLWGVVMVNKKEHYFKDEDLKPFTSVVNKHKEKIIETIANHTKPYT